MNTSFVEQLRANVANYNTSSTPPWTDEEINQMVTESKEKCTECSLQGKTNVAFYPFSVRQSAVPELPHSPDQRFVNEMAKLGIVVTKKGDVGYLLDWSGQTNSRPKELSFGRQRYFSPHHG